MCNPCNKSKGWLAVRPDRNDHVTVELPQGYDIFPDKKAVRKHILECKDCWAERRPITFHIYRAS